MTDESAHPVALGTIGERVAPVLLSITTLWFVTLLAAILSGSSTLNVEIAGKQAPLYWVDLWATVAYPLYLLVVREGKLPRVRQLWALMAVSLFWEVLGLSGAVDPLRGVRLLAIHIVGLIVYWFASFVALSRREAGLLTRLLLIAPIVMLLLSVSSIETLGSSLDIATAAKERVIESAVGRSNALATLFGMLGVLCMGLWVITARFRFLATLGMCGAGLGLSLTGSRAGLLATFAGIACYLWLGGGQGRRSKVFAAAALTAVLVLGLRAIGATGAVEDRFVRMEQAQTFREGPIQNVIIRLDYWRVALMMFRDRPIMGQGLGSFESYYLREGAFTIDRPTDPHNQLVLLLGETGLVGSLCAVALAVLLARRARPLSGEASGRAQRDILTAAVAVAFVHSLAEPVFRNPSSVALVALLLGLGANPTFFLQLDAARPRDTRPPVAKERDETPSLAGFD